jgi:hypothetical protein
MSAEREGGKKAAAGGYNQIVLFYFARLVTTSALTYTLKPWFVRAWLS